MILPWETPGLCLVLAIACITDLPCSNERKAYRFHAADFHLPIFSTIQVGVPAESAAVAAPWRNECIFMVVVSISCAWRQRLTYLVSWAREQWWGLCNSVGDRKSKSGAVVGSG